MTDQKSREEQQNNRWLNKSAQRFAEDYGEAGYPVPYERVFYFNTFKIRIVAEPHKDAQDTRPLASEIHTCGDCGQELQIVRPGKYQCVNPKCKQARSA